METPLRTLKPGAVFHLDLYEYGMKQGILVDVTRGSATVACKSTKPPRVIVSQDGRKSKPIAAPDIIQHWDLDTLVVPTGESEDVQRWLDKLKGETTMATAAAAITGKKSAKKAVKAKEPKKLLTTRYTVTAKAVPEKVGYENEEKQTHNAVIYRALKAAKEPLTFSEITDAIGKKEFGSESKAVDNIFRWHIQDLIKKGFVKSIEKREEVEAA
jgi:hypothetical protein